MKSMKVGLIFFYTMLLQNFGTALVSPPDMILQDNNKTESIIIGKIDAPETMNGASETINTAPEVIEPIDRTPETTKGIQPKNGTPQMTTKGAPETTSSTPNLKTAPPEKKKSALAVKKLPPMSHKSSSVAALILQPRASRSEPRYNDFMDELASHGILIQKLIAPDSMDLQEAEPKKVICYYDRTKSYAGPILELSMVDLNASMALCTHLVYGWAMVDRNSGKISLNHGGMNQLVEIQHLQMIHALKSFYPGFKVLLGIGAPPSEDDGNDNFMEFNNVLKSDESRFRFINSVVPVLQRYSFDGIDLIWKFDRKHNEEEEKPKSCGIFCKMWGGMTGKSQKKRSTPPNRYIELRNRFSDLIQEMKSVLFNYTMAVSISPQMDDMFYDKQVINYYADQIHLLTFDFLEPWNNLELAEHSAPLYKVDSVVNDWLWQDAQKNKIVVGVATYARTWKISSRSLFNTSPPVIADSIGPKGSYTDKEGLFSFYEVCIQLVEDGFTSSVITLNKVQEAQKYTGTYAYRLPTNFSEGLWISFEDPESISLKAKYVKERDLGGIIVHGLVYDDFKGMCQNKYDGSFPLLHSVVENIR